MGQTKKYKILGHTGATGFNNHYPGYKLYRAREEIGFSGHGPECFILSRESFINNQTLSADDSDELLDAQFGHEKIYNGLRLYVYRPTAVLEDFYKVKDEILSREIYPGFKSDGVEPHTHRLFIAARPVQKKHDGYLEDGKLCFIFSTVSYAKGEGIPAAELKRLVAPQARKQFEHFLHDDKPYKARVWAAIKASCG
jgi:hypothetical protein